ncbi:MAG: hypothetical protein JWO95_1871 [Verrucomicrobiales bacterium]|nr:hypothetical protein [Verrucomicrobiales bacterium]
METFNDLLTKWQPFFTAVAGATATLIGLLFVSLSINREKIAGSENRVLMRLAKRSFGDYIFVMFIALLFLMPNHNAYGLAIALTALIIVRGWFLLRSIVRPWNARHIDVRSGVREHILSTLAWLGLIATTIEIYRGNVLATFFLVPVISLLLCNASINAWALLIMEEKLPNKQPSVAELRSDSST